MLKVQRILSDLRVAQSATPIPLIPRSHTRGRPWLDWEIKEMVFLRKQGWTAKQIAKRLRRTTTAVEQKLVVFRRRL